MNGAAGRGCDHGCCRCALLLARWNAREQRQALDQRREGFDPGDAAVAQEGVGDVILAGQCTLVRVYTRE